MSKQEKLYAKAEKENPIPLPEEKSSLNCSPFINMGPLHKFQREYGAAQDYAGRYRVLRCHWFYVGENQLLPNIHQEVLSALIGYKYLRAAYNNAGKMMPDAAMRNLYALEKGDLNDLTPNMARMVNILIQTSNNRGEERMPKKANKKTVLGVSQFYLEIFENQAKAKLTDEQIIEVIRLQSGNAPTAKNVASYRCMYNAGRIQGQSKCPTIPEKCKAIRMSKTKPKKPMSEETKANLKAYTAAKKAKAAKKK